MTWQPVMRANCSAQIETPPVPSTRTVCPGTTVLPAPKRQFQAVTPAQGQTGALFKGVTGGKLDDPRFPHDNPSPRACHPGEFPRMKRTAGRSFWIGLRENPSDLVAGHHRCDP